MILSNATVMNEYFKLVKCDIQIENKKIVKIGQNLKCDDQNLDLTDCIILPGFIDTHIHGACGEKAGTLGNDLERITDYTATQGVTSLALTTSCDESFEKLLVCYDEIVNVSKSAKGSKIVGIHAEGPFLNSEKPGAMNTDRILTPDTEKLFELFKRSCGLLKIITVAPEVKNMEGLIRCGADLGISVSMGHTNATYEEAVKGIKAGAEYSTHTFNAMRELNHREPGILGAVLTTSDISCEVICDYVHLHPVVVRMIYQLKGADKMCIVSDATVAGLTEGETIIMEGKAITVKEGVAYTEDGTISGSAMSMLDGVRNLVKSGIPLEDVSKMASLNPAKRLKIEDETGSIAVGKYADIVVLDKNYNVKYTFINGICVHQKG